MASETREREERGAGAGRADGGWWNRTGWEECALCASRFDLEVEVRCADCDAPLCPLCAIEASVTTVTVCGPCARDEPREER